MLTGPPRIAGLWDDLNARGRARFGDLLRNIPLAHGVVYQRAGVRSDHRRPTRFRSRSSRAGAAGAATGMTTRETGGAAARAIADATRRTVHDLLRRPHGDRRSRRLQLRRTHHVGLRAGNRPEQACATHHRRRRRDGDLRDLQRRAGRQRSRTTGRLEFEGPGAFRDVFEPNDSAGAYVAPRPQISCGHD